MSHLKERKEKTCLNCQTEIIGRYCHVCGQENLEPKETVWHLVQHFFNDITHFDGKFFATLKYLLKKPGFLSLEYMRGRRMAYLNPVRMYVFTSAIFFIVLFSMSRPEKMARVMKEDQEETQKTTHSLADLRTDSARLQKKLAAADEEDKDDYRESLEKRNIEIAGIKKKYGDTAKQIFSNKGLDSILAAAYGDSLSRSNLSFVQSKKFRKAIRTYSKASAASATTENFNFLGVDIDYNTVGEYDSAEKTLPDSLRDGWLRRFIVRHGTVVKQEFEENQQLFTEHLLENIFHSFPKILWISLPIFALIMNILYYRHKQYYYVNHGIFAIHVYCATFIQLFLYMMLYALRNATTAQWLHIVIDLANFAIFLWMLIYLYKAMRGFYGQGRGKTFLKYFFICSLMFVINLVLLSTFLLISVFSV
ncbi:DUF3667 domain-containing protein [Puia dinghuensis]|uniref:DUF3667 domain-containing protein n=1 Tax=Puia dinghuensis TaxID=1792502 RepID=A0A8J2UD88_9BACT|nr:DUF3667 domain-containing protein [Puia dinghuensis]GGB01191.1 hypothetical protein GCM10011511_25630 [Puia dinghuensis]